MSSGPLATPVHDAAPGAAGGDRSGFRPDIQGLRAFAVVVVILEHILHWPAGGFVGVDVFFVISGFLITGLLMNEHDRTGSISFANFYRRRLRRILPLAVLVLVTTYLASSLLFLGERVRSTAWDALCAALFAANWRFASVGTDYWETDGPVSPLRHYWSLAVEEQFYLVWPVLLVLILGYAARRGRYRVAARWAVGVALIVIVLGSIGFALWEVEHRPTVAYFSTLSRAWELGIGALLAVTTPLLARIPATVRPAYQWSGLVGLMVSVFAITAQTPFPVPGAFLAVISTALVIAGGVGGQRLMAPLTNRAVRYVGDISYSLYLWHFPLLILIGAALPGAATATVVLTLGGTALLSVLSYHLVEDPIRRSSWLERQRTAGTRHRSRSALALRGAGLVALAVTVAVVTTVTVRTPSSQAPADSWVVTSRSELAAQVRVALDARDWPVLTPPLGELGAASFASGDGRGCRPAVPDGNDCAVTAPRPRRLAVVVGDSIGAAWLPLVRSALEPAGWVVQDLTYAGCPFLASDTVSPIDSITRSCPGHRRTVRTLIDNRRPDLVIVGNAYRQRFIRTGGSPSQAEWERAARTARQQWLAAAGKVVALQPPPLGPDPKTCITRLSTPRDCVSTLAAEHHEYAEVDRRAWGGGNSWHIPTVDWFCAAGRCPIFVGGIIVRRDGNHITAEYARKLTPLLGEALAPVLNGATD
ncbi:acyltransferase family protein [Verrucosispora sp. WMMD573]|uniref:acyltransferase family protein n=1 Tax=Verrucosispora sp. WMMD573 TaxID=3015149 RepID=UPI00248CC9F7|nr:acyltransferase family protein [Verrucosispora sp. WMMD573]WBB56778.1 acyltransferase family protein [Verrucosispora sp. WMMD573]